MRYNSTSSKYRNDTYAYYYPLEKKWLKALNLIVETKDVENQTDLRGTEAAKIACAKVFFKQSTILGKKWNLRYN